MIGKIVWFTGLSGSGKTTLSNSLSKKLHRLNYKVKKIDGDIFRKKTRNFGNFSKKNIYKNNISIINYIFKIQKNYEFIIVSVISPLQKTRSIAKRFFKENYFEIFVKCSISELVRRDTKGLYKLAKLKKNKNLIGYNSKIKYEKSRYKKLIIDTEKTNVSEATKKVLKEII